MYSNTGCFSTPVTCVFRNLFESAGMIGPVNKNSTVWWTSTSLESISTGKIYYRLFRNPVIFFSKRILPVISRIQNTKRRISNKCPKILKYKPYPNRSIFIRFFLSRCFKHRHVSKVVISPLTLSLE